MVRRPIVVVGSLNMDLVVSTARFPAPGETLAGSELKFLSGGKGANQAAAAARLGYPTEMVGRVGEDTFAAQLMSDLQVAGVGCAAVRRVPGSTGAAVITSVATGENSILVVAGANGALTPSSLDEAWPVIRCAGMVLTQLEIPLTTAVALGERCRAEAIPLMVDPAPAQPLPRALLEAASWLTPNETEAAALTGDSTGHGDLEECHTVVDRLRRQGASGIVLKLGARGVFLATSTVAELVPGFAVRARDTTAAGDCFNAAFAVALLRGEPAVAAARFANAAAALSTTMPGALPSMPTAAAVEQFLAASPC